MAEFIEEIFIGIHEHWELPSKNFEVLEGEKDFIVNGNTVYPVLGGKNLLLNFPEYDKRVLLKTKAESLSSKNFTGSLFEPLNIEFSEKLANRNNFIKAADVSSIYEVFRCGGKFYNEKGEAENVFSMLKRGGFNTVRLRLWNKPCDENGMPYGGGDSDLQRNLEIAKTAYAFGFDIMVDFHYSDFWADPASQRIPSEWSHLKSSDSIAKALGEFTRNSLSEFYKNGIKVRYVQIGNEITNGLITQQALYGKDIQAKKLKRSIRGNFGSRNFKKYLKAGIKSAKSVDKDILTVIHIDTGANAKRSLKFFGKIKKLDFDIIGLSYYPFFHGNINLMKETVTKLVKFNKPVFIAETSYAFTEDSHPEAMSVFSGANRGDKSYKISPQGQADLLCAITNVLLELPRNIGRGVCWWEPCWLPVKGAGWSGESTKPSWSDQALFSYDGVKLPSLDTFASMEMKMIS